MAYNSCYAALLFLQLIPFLKYFIYSILYITTTGKYLNQRFFSIYVGKKVYYT